MPLGNDIMTEGSTMTTSASMTEPDPEPQVVPKAFQCPECLHTWFPYNKGESGIDEKNPKCQFCQVDLGLGNPDIVAYECCECGDLFHLPAHMLLLERRSACQECFMSSGLPRKKVTISGRLQLLD